MTTNESLSSITMEAGADLSTKQYCFVYQDSSSGQLAAVSTSGGDAMGVLQNKPAAAGRAAEVGFDGVSKVVMGGVVNPGGLVMSDTSGRAVAATGSGKNVLGRYIGKTASATSDVGHILLAHPHILA